jgi:hypothetical protein
MAGKWKLTCVALMLGALTGPASAGASVQIGTDLSLGQGQSFNCSNTQQCSVFMSDLSPDSRAAGGLTSPVNGTVTGFQVNNGPQSTPLRLRVIRPFGGGLFNGAGTGPAVTPPINQISPLLDSGNLPISTGDSVGLECCMSGTNAVVFDSVDPVSEMSMWGTLASPPLPDNAPPSAPDDDNDNQQLMLRAVVEPTNTFTIGPPTRRGRTITFTATVPNPGTVEVRHVISGLLHKNGKKKNIPATVKGPPVVATQPGPVVVTMNVTTRTTKALFKFKQVLAIRYRPKFGVAGEDQPIAVSYKRKKRKKERR